MIGRADVEKGVYPSLVQGIHYYRDIGDSPSVPGLMHPVIGQYKVSDVVFTAAFDVNATKVGRDLADAIAAPPNNTRVFATVPHTTRVRTPHTRSRWSSGVP